MDRQRATLLAVAYAVQNPEEAAKLYTSYQRTIARLRDGTPDAAPAESTTAAVLRDPYLSGLVTRVVKQREDKRRAAALAARSEANERRR